VLRVDLGILDHLVECLIGEGSVGMNLVSVPSQLFEEAVGGRSYLPQATACWKRS
jgi:hypothetical protein